MSRKSDFFAQKLAMYAEMLIFALLNFDITGETTIIIT